MTNQRTSVYKLEAQANTEGLEKFRKGLENLQKQSAFVKVDIDELRKQVLSYSNGNIESIDSITSQISALQQLRRSVQIGGEAFRTLEADIAQLNTRLKQTNNEVDTTAKKQTGLQIATQLLTKSLSALKDQVNITTKQLGELKAGVSNLDKTTEEYAKTVEKINKLEASLSRRNLAIRFREERAALRELTKTYSDYNLVNNLVTAGQPFSNKKKAAAADPDDTVFDTTSSLAGLNLQLTQLREFQQYQDITEKEGLARFNQLAEEIKQTERLIRNFGKTEEQISAETDFKIFKDKQLANNRLLKHLKDIEDEKTRLVREAEREREQIRKQALDQMDQRIKAREAKFPRDILTDDGKVIASRERARRGTQFDATAGTGIGSNFTFIPDLSPSVVLRRQQKLKERAEYFADMSGRGTGITDESLKFPQRSIRNERGELLGFSKDMNKTLDDFNRKSRQVFQDVIREFERVKRTPLLPPASGRNLQNQPGVRVGRRPGESFTASDASYFVDPQNRVERILPDMLRAQMNPVQTQGRPGTGLFDPNFAYAQALPPSSFTRTQRINRFQPFEISGLYDEINNIGMDEITRQIERMGRSYTTVARDIRNASKASKGSVTALEAERRSWQQLQKTVNNGTKEYRHAAKEIKRLDDLLAAANNRFSNNKILRRFTSPGAARGMRAAAAGLGGLQFGGALSGLGAAAGSLVPGGGLIAPLVGQQVGQLGEDVLQAAAEAATYTAQVNKLRIALEYVTKTQDDAAASSRDYRFALHAINKASEDFNLSVEVATKGFTKLSASVIGAGGNVRDAELGFRAVTAAVKATGGSTQDIQSSFTALSQIFNKSRLSAEELQGQLGERIPGAVSLFARETGRSLPALARDLRDGVIGLDDVMKFLRGLEREYEASASAIADSTEEAGARLERAFNALKYEVGSTLLQPGAALQDTGTAGLSFAKDVTVLLKDLSSIVFLQYPQDSFLGKFQSEVVRLAASLDPMTQQIQRLMGFVEVYMKFRDQFASNNGPEGPDFTDFASLTGEQLEKRLESIRAKAADKGIQQADAAYEIQISNERRIAQASERHQQKLQSIKKSHLEQLETLDNQRNRSLVRIINQANRQRKKIEDDIADKRLDVERKINDIRSKSLLLEEEITLTNAAISGNIGFDEAQSRLNALQEAEVFNQAMRDADRAAKDEIAQVERTIEEFKATNAEQIRRLNESHEERIRIAKQNNAKKIRDADIAHQNVIEKLQKTAAERINKILNKGVVDRNELSEMFAELQRYKNIKQDKDIPLGEPDKMIADIMISNLTKDISKFVSERFGIDLNREDSASAASSAPQTRSIVENSQAAVSPDVGFIPPANYPQNVPVSQQITAPSTVAFEQDRQSLLDKQLENLLKGVLAQIGNSFKANVTGIRSKAEQTQSETRSSEISSQYQSLGMREGFSDKLASLDIEEEKVQQNIDRTLADQLAKIRQMNVSDEQRTKLVEQAQFHHQETSATLQDSLDTIVQQYAAQENLALAAEKSAEAAKLLKEQMQPIVEVSESIAQSIGDGLLQAMTLAIEGTQDWGESLRQILADVSKQIAQTVMQILVIKPLVESIKGGLSSLGGNLLGNASGNAFNASNNIVPYAKGGVVNSPTLFRYKNGGILETGVAGEAGPEAILPLRRGRNGQLGVASEGGSSPMQVTVNVDARGTTSSGDQTKGNQLGKAVAIAVQQELIKQRRPGGILA